MSFQLFGLPVSRGIAIGRAVLVASSRLDVAHYYVAEGELEAEVERLRDARDISPADMLQFKGGVFLGFVTDVGGKTSHTAIVARSMDIPAVVGAREASRLIRQDDWVIIDGDAGIVIVDPSPAVVAEYRAVKLRRDRERAGLARLR